MKISISMCKEYDVNYFFLLMVNYFGVGIDEFIILLLFYFIVLGWWNMKNMLWYFCKIG